MEQIELIRMISNKKVLFVTTKNIDYIRNSQEISILKEYAESVDVLYSKNKNNPLRILDVLFKLRSKRVKAADVVFLGFEPQFVVPFKRRLLKKKPLIVDFFISVYDTLIDDRQKFKDGSFMAKRFISMDKKTLGAADLVITDTTSHMEYFRDTFDGADKKYQTLYLEADKSIYFPRPQQKEDSLKDKYVVLYFGSILPLQGVDVVLDTIRELKDEKDIFFDIIGPIPDKYDKPQQENVRYTSWLSQPELADRIGNADLCLAGHFNGKINKANRTIPGKAYIYEAMEKDIILGDSIANHELYSDDFKHTFVTRGSSKALAETIRMKRDNWSKV